MLYNEGYVGYSLDKPQTHSNLQCVGNQHIHWQTHNMLHQWPYYYHYCCAFIHWNFFYIKLHLKYSNIKTRNKSLCDLQTVSLTLTSYISWINSYTIMTYVTPPLLSKYIQKEPESVILSCIDRGRQWKCGPTQTLLSMAAIAYNNHYLNRSWRKHRF